MEKILNSEPVKKTQGSLGEWSSFLTKLHTIKGNDTLLIKARVPERLYAHLEDRFALMAEVA